MSKVGLNKIGSLPIVELFSTYYPPVSHILSMLPNLKFALIATASFVKPCGHGTPVPRDSDELQNRVRQSLFSSLCMN